MIRHLRLRNFRGLQKIDWPLEALQVIFGPNGAGKSSLLDAFSFLRDTAINGAERASSRRDHGIGLRFDGAAEPEAVEVGVSTESAEYRIEIRFQQGRIDPLLGEELLALPEKKSLLKRNAGSAQATLMLDDGEKELVLREPDKLALASYLVFDERRESPAVAMDQALRKIHFYSSRNFNFWQLRSKGSEVDVRYRFLDATASNLWAVLRFLNDRRAVDGRMERILSYMRLAFPKGFEDLVLDQTAPNVIIGSFLEKGRAKPIAASGVSDGYLQLLTLLTALFGQQGKEPQLILFDEPETSLHPEATGVFSEAVSEATQEWERQVIIATHHPALLSQIDQAKAWELDRDENGQARLHRVVSDPGIRDLLESFPLGSLYMAGAVAPQNSD